MHTHYILDRPAELAKPVVAVGVEVGGQRKLASMLTATRLRTPFGQRRKGRGERPTNEELLDISVMDAF